MEEDKIDIELSKETAQGTYSNLAIISHSTAEFFVDFVRMVPGVPKAEVKSRIILTPEHAKRLMLTLQENIERYEATFCEIKLRLPENPAIKSFSNIES